MFLEFHMFKPVDYKAFDAEWNSLFQSADLAYYSDLCFQSACVHAPRIERKFRFGVLSWLTWFFGKHFFHRVRGESGLPHVGMVLSGISTTAHEETIAAFAVRSGCAPDQIRFLCPGDCPLALLELSRLTPLDLGFVGRSIGKRDKIMALARALKITLKIRFRIRDHADFATRIANSLPSILDGIYRLESCLSGLKRSLGGVGMCVVTYELQSEMKALTLFARERGVKVIHIMHGQRLPTYQITMATDLLLFSKVDEPWFRARVAPETRIWTIGHPRLESVRREVGARSAADGGRKPRIAFFSQPAEGDYSKALRRRDWALLGSLSGRAEVRFRLHPRESREEAERDLAAMGLDFVELSEAGLVEDLRWCDAVASSWSTVSMEAAACGRGVFWTCTMPERYEASAELRDHGIGLLIREPRDWQAPLDDWAAGEWRAPVMIPESQIRELGMIGDMDRPWLERLALVDLPA